MERREFLHSAVVGGVAAAGLHVGGRQASSADPRRHYELRMYEMRSDVDSSRLRTFLQDALLPAYSRAGAGVVGVFSPDTGFPSQNVILLVEYPSLGAVEDVAARMESDAAFSAARRTFDGGDALPYVRYDSQLMRAFTGHPRIEVPAPNADKSPRMFELRTYEARSHVALQRKIAMFNEQEITLFRNLDMTPVFFGENIFGTRLPSLSYMLTFSDIAARQKAWAAFGAHPDWQRINKEPKYNDVPGNVTVTNVAYLRPLSFSAIR
jgi:NIPSNAP